MKINLVQLRHVILQNLNELFDYHDNKGNSHTYQYKISYSSAVKPGEMPWGAEHKILHQTIRYSFHADHINYEDGLDYDVSFTLQALDWDVIWDEERDDRLNPEHYYWEINFDTEQMMRDMTNRKDSRILPTIASIVINFFNNYLPTLEDKNVTSFGFEGISEVGREKTFDQRTKRTRVYTNMIMRYAKHLGLNVSMSTMSTGANSVIFKVNKNLN